ncbi:MAG: hypothetical protein LUI02_06840 [Clostridiales bacterium]|nr:hypothetical protein [Clostridiales bacterium]
MSAQSDLEKVLRDLHVLLSKSEPYPKDASLVVVDRQRMIDLLEGLNQSISRILDECEMTKSSRERAQREFQKQGDEIIWDASRKAEDIYAASVMYMDEALNGIQEIMKDAQRDFARICEDADERIKKETRRVKANQSELGSQLQDLVDTEKYLKIIEDRNREKEREKAKREGKKPELDEEKALYSNRTTEIKINQEYLDRLGLSVVDGGAPAAGSPGEMKSAVPDIQVNENAAYFKWKEAQGR